MAKEEIIGIFLLILLVGIIIGYLLNYYFETKKTVSEYNKKLKYIKFIMINLVHLLDEIKWFRS